MIAWLKVAIPIVIKSVAQWFSSKGKEDILLQSDVDPTTRSRKSALFLPIIAILLITSWWQISKVGMLHVVVYPDGRVDVSIEDDTAPEPIDIDQAILSDDGGGAHDVSG